jgi:spermidine synthase
VLGATTHAFELMLSAFILGLALGGWWIRGRIERLTDPVVSLARIQLAMGALAVLTLPLYGQAFELMESVLSVLTRTSSGYEVFLFTSHAIALLVMLPATICAGMTLPLITHLLVAGGGGERSVGVVYAANTLGAILAVLFSVHVLLPVVGLKSLIVIGGLIDVGVGVVLIRGLRGVAPGRKTILLGATCGLVLVFVASAVSLDPRRMSSGVFRTGNSMLPDKFEVLFQHDGKTATVAVLHEAPGTVTVLTNGKPDASIHMGEDSERGADESTQVLLGALPLALRPDIREVAVVGLGSGLTTRAVLGSGRLERVDTVEIENGILLAAEYFRPLVDPVFTDPRSRVHIDDAKTFFSTQGRRYDLIISEPSNPWVSGVSSLFTREFYRHLRRYLRPDGLLVQWLQIYEIDLPLAMSVLKALDAEFPNYEIYQFDQGDVGIVAVNGDRLPRASAAKLSKAGVVSLLERIGIRSAAELEILSLGSSAVLRPLVNSFRVPENSDYFPILDLNAPRARFLQQGATALFDLVSGPVPVIEMLSRRSLPEAVFAVDADAPTARAHAMRRAQTLRAYVTGENTSLTLEVVPPAYRQAAVMIRGVELQCGDPVVRDLWFENARRLSQEIVAYLSAQKLLAWWRVLRAQPCFEDLLPSQQRWLTLLEALGERAAPEVAGITLDLLRSIGDGLSTADRTILIKASLASHLVLGDVPGAARVWREFGESLDTQLEADIVLRLLVSHAGMFDTPQTTAALKQKD